MFVKYLLNSSAILVGSDTTTLALLSVIFGIDWEVFVDTRSLVPFHRFFGFDLANNLFPNCLVLVEKEIFFSFVFFLYDETQLTFAVHYATSGLGISTKHFDAESPLVRALYRFHTYYHVRRILSRIRVSTPSQKGFDKYNNAFSFEEVRRIGNEYGCGTENLSIYRIQYYFDKSGRGSHVSYAHNNWSRWIMNSSRGFTKHGI